MSHEIEDFKARAVTRHTKKDFLIVYTDEGIRTNSRWEALGIFKMCKHLKGEIKKSILIKGDVHFSFRK
jgi:hypothetical protein